MRPVSSPAVEKSHTTGTAAMTPMPSGTTNSRRSCRRRAATAATTNAPVEKAREATTVAHSMRRTWPSVARTPTSTPSHSGLVQASTRSPALKTGPCPAKIWSTIRRLMNASSFIQWWRHPPTRIASAGTSRTRSWRIRRDRAVRSVRAGVGSADRVGLAITTAGRYPLPGTSAVAAVAGSLRPRSARAPRPPRPRRPRR